MAALCVIFQGRKEAPEHGKPFRFRLRGCGVCDMKKGNFWPTRPQELLLATALSDEQEAKSAWEAIAEQTEFDVGSQRQAPLVYTNLVGFGLEHPHLSRFSPVGVVIPAHNAERFVAEAIDSVLAQSVPTQLIVVDDGSTDTTGAIADAYGSALHCIHQAQRGLAGARNRGLAAARHEWIAFLDADDRWETGKLERQCAVLSAHQDVDMVFGHYVEFASGEDDGEGLIPLQDGILAPEHTGAGRRDILRAVP